MSETKNDLTVIYYTANVISDYFADNIWAQLVKSFFGSIITVSKKPMPNCGKNIVVDLPRHHLSIYKQALIGAKVAETKYIALVEDDVLYSAEHFKHRSSPGKFAYNMNTWNIFTWSDPPIFSAKLGGRINLNGLICERDLFIEAMEERFKKYPNYDEVDLRSWAEPGKYENHLGVTVREREAFHTNPPNIVFSHETALSFENLGIRKRVGEVRANEIPYWGTALKIRELYK